MIAFASPSGTSFAADASRFRPVDSGRDRFTAGLVRSFGDGGRVVLGPAGNDAPRRVVIDRDGGVLLATLGGVSRFNAHGRLDRSYLGLPEGPTSPSQRRFPFSLWDAELDAAGRLVVSGSIGRRDASGRTVFDPAIARLLRSGRADPAFGTAGIARLPGPSGVQGQLTSVRVAGGGVLAAGFVILDNGQWVPALVARVDDRGMADGSLSPGGVRVLPRTVGFPDALDGGDGAFLVLGAAHGGGAVAVKRQPDGSLDDAFGAAGRVRLPGAEAIAAPPRAGPRIIVAWTDRQAGAVFVAAISPAGMLDASFGRNGVARVALGTAVLEPSVTATPDGGVAVVAGIRGSLTAVLLDRRGRPDRAFGALGATCVPFESQGDDGLATAFGTQAASSSAGLTVAGAARYGDENAITLVRLRWRGRRLLACTTAVQRGDAIRFSGVRSRAGRLELVLRGPGRGGSAGQLVATLRFAVRPPGAHADLWNRRLHGRRVPCQVLIATPRLVSPAGRVLGTDAPIPLYPNCPGADV